MTMHRQYARHYIVHGRVQGVFFRRATQNEAIRLGVNGWARNLPDGTVEAYAIGDQAAVSEFERWMKNGPRGAGVRKIDIVAAPIDELSEFVVRQDTSNNTVD